MATRDSQSAEAILSIKSVVDLFEGGNQDFAKYRCQRGRQRGDRGKFVVPQRLNRAKKFALKGGYFGGFVQAPAGGDSQQD